MDKNFLSSIVALFNKLTIQQRFLIGGIIVGTFVIIGLLVFVYNEPDYNVLYTNLAPEDAAKIVDDLTASKIPYKIEDNGQTIRVPEENVYKTRLSLAAKGLPNSGIVGYEIFDQTSMGMSEFQQKLNYKRALEGELARTIMQQEGVEGARVQIVIPQKTVFKDEEKEPTASVVLKLKPSFNISNSNIVAISNLVSSSVEGLKPNKVTILDTKGRLLSKEFDETPLSFSSSKQYEIKRSIEDYLAQKAQTILDNVLGYGNSLVQVTADLDFNQVEKTMELYDPESQVAVSEQTIKSNANATDAGDQTGQETENSTVNYEISKTIQKVIESAGNIKRLSVAAVINGTVKTTTEGEETKQVYEPRSDEQMRKLEDIVKKAVGLDANRNDQVSIMNIPFEPAFEDATQNDKSSPFDVDDISKLALIFVAVGASMFLIRSLMKRLKTERILVGQVSQKPEAQLKSPLSSDVPDLDAKKEFLAEPKKKKALPVPDIEDEITDEAALKQMQHEKIVNYVQKNPAEAAKLITSWLHEDEY